MRVNRFLGLTILFSAGWLCLPACSGSSSCADNNACGTGGSSGSAGSGGSGASAGSGGSGASAGTGGSDGGAGTGGASGSGGDGGGCDTSKSPSAESCLVDDQYAVFVDGTASASGDGSKASPFKTIGEALAGAAGKIILVCDTTYAEQVKLGAGAKIFGGFKCTDWSYDGGQRAVVAPTSEGYALEIDSVTDPVVIEDVEFDAADASTPGASSVAGFVHGSTEVVLRRDKLVGGKGATGSAGAAFGSAATTGATGHDGKNACSSPASGGPQVETQCGGAASGSIGGSGGRWRCT